MCIVIAGCGRVGERPLAEERHDVSVIDSSPEAFAALGSAFDETTHTGSPTTVVRLGKALDDEATSVGYTVGIVLLGLAIVLWASRPHPG